MINKKINKPKSNINFIIDYWFLKNIQDMLKETFNLLMEILENIECNTDLYWFDEVSLSNDLNIPINEVRKSIEYLRKHNIIVDTYLAIRNEKGYEQAIVQAINWRVIMKVENHGVVFKTIDEFLYNNNGYRNDKELEEFKNSKLNINYKKKLKNGSKD